LPPAVHRALLGYLCAEALDCKALRKLPTLGKKPSPIRTGELARGGAEALPPAVHRALLGYLCDEALDCEALRGALSQRLEAADGVKKELREAVAGDRGKLKARSAARLGAGRGCGLCGTQHAHFQLLPARPGRAVAKCKAELFSNVSVRISPLKHPAETL